MAALAPAEFVAQATERGFVFSVKPDGSLGVKPPAPGAMTDSVRRYVSTKKPELLALLSGNPIQSKGSGKPHAIERIGTGKPQLNHKPGGLPPHVLDQAQTVASRQLPKPLAIECLPKSQTLDTEHFTKVSPLLAWALSEARYGTLPELSEAMTLPSGQVCPSDGVAAWLQAAETRASGLRSHSGTSPDCALAFEVVLRDMRALARWAADARVWLDAPRTHQGEVSLLPAVEEELRQLAAEFEADLPDLEEV